MRDWVGRDRLELLAIRDRSGGWGYRSDRGPSVEATALACLGLRASEEDDHGADDPGAVRRGAEWLLRAQHADGSLGVSATAPAPGWATPYALLVWNALGIAPDARRRAAAWLLGREGRRIELEEEAEKAVVGHDPRLVGWPWVDGTHSWVEPTALAVLALGREGLRPHPRVLEGTRLLLDRAVEQGGWNYGNRAAFGRTLRSQPGPTGLALLALAAQEGCGHPPAIDRALAYLCATLPAVRAPISLGWGVLGLRAWDASPEEAKGWLADSYARHSGRRDQIVGLGLLLLAARDRFLTTSGGVARERTADGARTT